MYKSISIQNFRGIRDLNLKDLGLINIFLGRNNFGKTSILESFFLLSGMSNAEIPSRLNLFRDPRQAPNPLGQIKYIFHNVQTENHPTFIGEFDNGEYRSTCISLSNSKTLQGAPILRNGMITSSEQRVSALCLALACESGKILSNSKKKKEHSFTVDFCTYENGQYSQDAAHNYHENMLARYIASDNSAFNLTEELSSIVRASRKDDIVQLIKLFDSRINNIEVLPDSTYVSYDGIENLIPISMCGDGLKKFLYIISCVAGNRNNLLLIDEIDNGIHFSAYPLLWSSIIKLAKRNNVQMMISTHSKEVLSVLAEVIDNANSLDICAYTITKGKDDIMHSYRYDGSNIKTAIENHLELRD